METQFHIFIDQFMSYGILGVILKIQFEVFNHGQTNYIG
jgi:hypothetical protein